MKVEIVIDRFSSEEGFPLRIVPPLKVVAQSLPDETWRVQDMDFRLCEYADTIDDMIDNITQTLRDYYVDYDLGYAARQDDSDPWMPECGSNELSFAEFLMTRIERVREGE